jgi:hypothetical protein
MLPDPDTIDARGGLRKSFELHVAELGLPPVVKASLPISATRRRCGCTTRTSTCSHRALPDVGRGRSESAQRNGGCGGRRTVGGAGARNWWVDGQGADGGHGADHRDRNRAEQSAERVGRKRHDGLIGLFIGQLERPVAPVRVGQRAVKRRLVAWRSRARSTRRSMRSA